MGAWNVEPWDNDEAADWFAKFFKGCDLTLIRNEINNFSELDEIKYDQIRAVCFLLQNLARPYVWPIEDDGQSPRELILRGINILSNMIDPPNPQWSFLEMWDNDEKVIKSVKLQIQELKQRLSEWKT